MDIHWPRLKQSIIDFRRNVYQVIGKTLAKISLLGSRNGWYCSMCRKEISMGKVRERIIEHNENIHNLCCKNGTYIFIENDNEMIWREYFYDYYDMTSDTFNQLYQKYGLQLRPITYNFVHEPKTGLAGMRRTGFKLNIEVFSLETDKNPVLEFLSVDIGDYDAKDLLFILNQTYDELIDLFVKNSFMNDRFCDQKWNKMMEHYLTIEYQSVKTQVEKYYYATRSLPQRTH